jgi:hypothetical protein
LYVYVASSWRCPYHAAVIAALEAAKIDHYNFRDSEGFSWTDVNPAFQRGQRTDFESYINMISHPVAARGFRRDFAAMNKADTFVLVQPCGKSAHLELGWAIGTGKSTAVLFEPEVEPDLMYRMAGYLTNSLFDLLGWLGVVD